MANTNTNSAISKLLFFEITTIIVNHIFKIIRIKDHVIRRIQPHFQQLFNYET